MLQENCFPIPIPNGIIYRDNIYTTPSLIGQKAGLNGKTIVLKDLKTSIETELALSSKTTELQMFNLALKYSAIKKYQQQVSATLETEYSLPIEEVQHFADQIYELMKIFYEDTKKSSINPNLNKKFKLICSELVPEARETMDPRIAIMHPFEHSIDLLVDLATNKDFSNISNSDSPNYDGLYKRMMEDALSNLLNRAKAYFNACTQKKETPYPTTNSDIIREFIVSYSNSRGLLYYSWSQQKPVKIMHAQNRISKETRLILTSADGKERYFSLAKEFTETEFIFGLNLLLASAAINSIPPQSARGINRADFASRIKSIFPLNLENGVLSIEQQNGLGMEITANLKFPPYAVTDPSNPDYVLLMKPGQGIFYYNLAQKGELTLKKLEVIDLERKPYKHFFGTGSYFCGLKLIEPQNTRGYALSRIIWENYQLLFTFLTDSLKGDVHNRMKEHITNRSITIHGHTFETDYVPRKVIKDFNETLPKQKKLHIGDARIK